MGVQMQDADYEELDGSGDSQLHSSPRAINAREPPSDGCNSSHSASPHWPQSFGRTMDIYTRSTSRRNRSDFGHEAITSSEQEHNCNENLVTALSGERKDLNEPLLKDSGPYDVETGDNCLATKENGISGLRTGGSLYGSGVVAARINGEEHTEDINEHGSSFIQALFNGMNVLAGVGILSTPYATAQGGWLGLSLLILFAIVCCYTAILLRRCLDSDPYIKTYPDVGEASFGKWGRWIVSILLYLELYAVCIEFLILEGDNMAQLFPYVSLRVGSIILQPQTFFIIMSAMLMLPTVWLRDLSLLSYVSAGGVFASVLIVLAVGWIGLLDGVGFHHQGSLVHFSGLPVAVGLYSFCFCGHSVFPSIYGSMRDRKQFSHVLVICFILCSFIYGGIAVMGYLMFGDDLQSQVTLNLPQGRPASHLAICITLVNPFAKYALSIMPIAVALEEFLPRSAAGYRKDVVFWGTIMRTLLVMSTVLVAISLPFFGLLMAFIGSFLGVAVSIHLPCICYVKIYGWRVTKKELALIVFVVILGLFVGVLGTYFSVKAIVGNFVK